jgi:hypothetical protein
MAEGNERFTNVMMRYELKYLMDRGQTACLVRQLKGHMEPDLYGKTTIASLYYDTPDRRLIRASMDKPDFKEKMRLRSYGPATENSPVFLELKRKASGIVYKRRVRSTIPEVRAFFDGENELFADRQISRELNWFRDSYEPLEPACLILYDRVAYFEPDGDLRLTIDFNPRYRMEDLWLTGDMEGDPLLAEGDAILEVKVQAAMPLWLSAILDEGQIYKSSFSKYGEAYRKEKAAGTKPALRLLRIAG